LNVASKVATTRVLKSMVQYRLTVLFGSISEAKISEWSLAVVEQIKFPAVMPRNI